MNVGVYVDTKAGGLCISPYERVFICSRFVWIPEEVHTRTYENVQLKIANNVNAADMNGLFYTTLGTLGNDITRH
jgi:hypothetical protein